jgi:iron complex transport system ATP-binding protein
MSALVFERITVRYGAREALTGMSAAFDAGKVTGIVGPNGAGKTTLLRAAIGLLPPTSGAIRVQDKNLAEWKREALARALAYLPQGGTARWPMTARDVVMLGRLPHRAAMSPPAPADLKAADEALARCDAEAFAARRMDMLSAGERARVLLARALAVGAPVLLADEPAAFLDPAHQLRLMELLQEEAARGAAVIVTLHDLALASRFCDEILVLHQGAVAASGAPQDALSDAVLASVFAIAAERVQGAQGAGTIAGFRRLC